MNMSDIQTESNNVKRTQLNSPKRTKEEERLVFCHLNEIFKRQKSNSDNNLLPSSSTNLDKKSNPQTVDSKKRKREEITQDVQNNTNNIKNM